MNIERLTETRMAIEVGMLVRTIRNNTEIPYWLDKIELLQRCAESFRKDMRNPGLPEGTRSTMEFMPSTDL